MRIRTRKQEIHTKGQYLWSSDVRGKWKLFLVARPSEPDVCLDGFRNKTIQLEGSRVIDPDEVLDGYRSKQITLTGNRGEK